MTAIRLTETGPADLCEPHSVHGERLVHDEGEGHRSVPGRTSHIESLGGVLLDAYYCLGKYDAVAILDFPDHRSAMKASVRNSSLGHVRVTTMPALTRTAWRDLLRELWGVPTANNWWRGSHQKPSSPTKK